MKSITQIGSFACKNDGSEDFKEILELFNKERRKHHPDDFDNWQYYGVNEDGNEYGTNYVLPNTRILSVSQVRELMSEKKKGMRFNPIFYKNAEEMKKPLSELMEELRLDISRVRGKLFDIKQTHGHKDRVEHIEGGLTCMLAAMFNVMEEWKKLEKKSTPEPNSQMQ